LVKMLNIARQLPSPLVSCGRFAGKKYVAAMPVISKQIRTFESDDKVPSQTDQAFGRRAYELEVEAQGQVL